MFYHFYHILYSIAMHLPCPFHAGRGRHLGFDTNRVTTQQLWTLIDYVPWPSLAVKLDEGLVFQILNAMSMSVSM